MISKSLMPQFIIVIVIISTIVLTVFGYYQYIVETQELTNQLYDSLSMATNRLSISLRTPLYAFQEEGIMNVVLSEMDNPAIVGIFILEAWKDEPTYSYARNEDGLVIVVDNVYDFLPDEYITKSKKVIHDEYNLGEVHVFITTQYMKERLLYSIISNMIQIVILGIILVVFMIFLLSQKVIRPITKLESASIEIAKGNLDTKIEIKSKDEIGELASAFSQMTKDLKESRKEIEKYSKGLEKQVKERTKELEAKVDELERFSRLAIGREIRMVELKKRIKEIEKHRIETGGGK